MSNPAEPLRVALVGCGYWGRNLLRNVRALPEFALVAVAEIDAARRAELEKQSAEEARGAGAASGGVDAGAGSARSGGGVNNGAPAWRVVADWERDVLADPAVEAVVIATPAADHAAHVRAALEAGKHVLVEKPLALTAADAAALGRLAADRRRTLMIGHTFLYHAAVLEARAAIARGDLGDIFYLMSQRLALGTVRADVDAMWNLAPHDISIANFLLDEEPVTVAAAGSAFLQSGLCDVQFLHLRYASGRSAHLHVSWLHPRKVREVTVVGARRMLVFDDVAPPERKLAIHDQGYDRAPAKESAPSSAGAPRRPPSPPPFETFQEFQLIQRRGEVRHPTIDFSEPLAEELRHFAQSVRAGAAPRTDARNGLVVVATLEAAARSLAVDGAAVALADILG